MKHTSRIIVGLAVALTGLASIHSARAEAPLLASVEIRGLGNLIQDVNRVAMGLQLGPQGALLTPVLDQALGGSGFEGVDTNGVLTIFVYGREPDAAPTTVKPIAVTLPTPDNGRRFMDGLTNSLQRGTSDGGIVPFTARDGDPMPRPNLYVGTEEGYAILGEDRTLVSRLMQEVGSGRLHLGKHIAVPGTLAVDINLAAAGTRLQNALNKAANAMPAATGAGPDTASVLRAEGNAFKSLIDQMETFHFGLGAATDSIALQSQVVAKPESVVGRVIKGSHAPRREFLTALPEGLAVAQAGHLGDVDAFLELYKGLISQILGSLGGEASGLSSLVEQYFTDAKGLATGEYAMGLWQRQNATGLGYVYYLGVKDPARVQALFDGYVARFAETNIAVPGMKFRAERGAQRQHKDIPVTAYSYQLSLSPELQQSRMGVPGMLAQWTNTLYEVAFVGDICVMTTGGAEAMNASLDRLLTPGGSITEFKSFRALFPGDAAVNQAVQVVSVSLVDYAKMILGMMPGIGLETLAMFPATGSGMAGYTIAEGASLRSVIKIGLDELAALKSMVPFVMMGAMSQGGPGGGPMGMPSPGMPEEPEAMDDSAAP